MKKSSTLKKSEVTFKSVCDVEKIRLCQVPVQDFDTASTVREIQRAVDPEGRKKLTPSQVRTLKAFLALVVKVG